MTTMRDYYRPVVNQAGYILDFPNIGDAGKLLQSYPPNPYAENIAQLFPIGTIMKQGRREWAYSKNGASALGIAVPLQSAARIHAEADNDIVVGAASAIGATTVTLTSTANLATAPLSTKDGFAEGFLIVNDAAGEGQMYQIKGHELATGTSNFVVTLYDPLTIALTTSSQVGLIQHPNKNVIAAVAVMTGAFAGVPLLAITANYYFWAQIKGPAPVVVSAVIALGTKVVLGTTAAEGDVAVDVTTEVAIGYPLTPGQTTDVEYMMVMLT